MASKNFYRSSSRSVMVEICLFDLPAGREFTNFNGARVRTSVKFV
jgi:hypothetical protein